jgi:hypothetical protein
MEPFAYVSFFSSLKYLMEGLVANGSLDLKADGFNRRIVSLLISI